jgi:hypothetical protein
MNKNTKKVRFGLVDALILLLAVSIVAFGVWFFFENKIFDGGDDVKIRYEIKLTDIRSELTSHIHIGDSVYDGTYGEHVGVVENVRHEQYTEQIVDKDTGEPVNAVKAGYYNVYVTVVSSAKYKDSTYSVADTQIRVGELLYLRLPDFSGNGYCTSFELIKEEG